MKRFTSVNHPEIVGILKSGGIGVLRTDTLYGVVAVVSDESAVHRVYELKGRDASKSPIVLVGDTGQLFDRPSRDSLEYLSSVWPGPVSVILPSLNAPQWIRRDNASVAYRLPEHEQLRALLGQVGPLIAPSANPEGDVPAMNIDQAMAYFGDAVDFYVDSGEVRDASPSQLIRIGDDGSRTRLR